MRRKFFFLQNDTKINDSDEGVLILELFLWGNVIFKFCFFCIKVTIQEGRNFFDLLPRIVHCKVSKLRNECFSLFMLSSFFKARADTLPGEAKQWQFFGSQ